MNPITEVLHREETKEMDELGADLLEVLFRYDGKLTTVECVGALCLTVIGVITAAVNDEEMVEVGERQEAFAVMTAEVAEFFVELSAGSSQLHPEDLQL